MRTARAALAILCLAFAGLVFLPAPHVFIWRLKLVASEFGHWLAFLPIAIVTTGRMRSRIDAVTFVIAILSAGVFLSSSVRAALRASAFVASMDAEFSIPGDKRGSPFSMRHLWSFSVPKSVGLRTFEFAVHDRVPLRLDFFPAQGRRPAPCVIAIPGGGWENCDREDFAAINRHLARRGCAVASIDYRVAPRWQWPAQKADVLAALEYLKARSEELGLDSNRFVLLGRSAGAQIAGAVAAGGERPEIAGCVMFYGPADMHFAAKYADPSDILDSDKLLRQFLGGTPEQSGSNYDTASPYALANARTPPTLLLHGTTDELVWVRQSQRYSDRLRSLHVRHAFLEIPWATHAFDYNFNGPGGQLAKWAVGQFLDSIAPH